MKATLRYKIRKFIQSEEGKVGIKSPLTLGVATGSILLAQAIVGTSPAMACQSSSDCPVDQECKNVTCWDVWGERTCLGECLP